jgi:hypothetical protein
VVAQEHWDRIKTKISVKGQYVEADLLTTFTEMRCPHGSDVQMFPGQMRLKHEKLAAVGHIRLQLAHRGLRDPSLNFH